MRTKNHKPGSNAIQIGAAMSKEVNFVFRIEKLAGSLGISLLTSAAGKSKLAPLINCDSAGAHDLKGFEGKHEFFSC
jgi:hypothetical protein